MQLSEMGYSPSAIRTPTLPESGGTSHHPEGSVKDRSPFSVFHATPGVVRHQPSSASLGLKQMGLTMAKVGPASLRASDSHLTSLRKGRTYVKIVFCCGGKSLVYPKLFQPIYAPHREPRKHQTFPVSTH